MRVLMISGHEFMEKQDNGGKQCTFRNYMLLKEIVGEKNLFLFEFSMTNQKDDNIINFRTYQSKVGKFLANVYFRPKYFISDEPKILKKVGEIKPDIVFFDSSLNGILASKIKKKYPNIAIVLFLLDIEKNYLKNCIKHKGPIYILPYISFSISEKKVVEAADKVICLNRRDEQLVHKYYKKKVNMFLPISFSDNFSLQLLQQYNSTNNTEKKLLFVGSLFQPNVESIKWFCKKVMPRLKNVCLEIVGKNMENLRTQLETPNIKVIGTVDNLDKYYYRADAVVIPILYGDGMKVKTAEAMMYGKTIFATEEALEGYDVEGTNNIFLCKDEKDFTQNIHRYFRNNEESRYNSNVRELFLHNYETSVLKKDLHKLLVSSIHTAEKRQ